MTTRSPLRFLLESLEGLTLLPFAVLTWPVTHRWLRNWGSRPAERERHWLGDDLLPDRVRSATRAITIEAPPRVVWQRLVQFALDRAGFYSYELLERLGGIPVTNVESVESEWQSIAVGDEVLLYPDGGVRLSTMEEERSLCFGHRTSKGRDVLAVSWSFYIEPEAEGSCRLLTRTCFGPPAGTGLVHRLKTGFEAALDAVMERRMLRSLKRLSEP